MGLKDVALVVLGFVLSQVHEWLKFSRDRKKRDEDRADAFQRENLVHLQEALAECTAAIGRFLTAAGVEPDRKAALLEAAARGRQITLHASRVNDEALRTAAGNLATRLGDALAWRQVDKIGTHQLWQERIAELNVLIERIGTRLREPRSLALPNASVITTPVR